MSAPACSCPDCASCQPDRALLSRARSGDGDAVAELYREHACAALNYARAITSNNADAEDLVAESFTQVIAQLALDKGPHTSFRAYLFTTMRHGLYTLSQREIPIDDEAVLDRAVCDRGSDEWDDFRLLRRAFDMLRAHDQEVLLLLDVEGLRPTQACAQLGIRANTLSMRAARARNALAEAYLAAHLQPSTWAWCGSIRPQLVRYVRGTLPATRANAVLEHLAYCSTCTNAVDELDEVNRGLRAIGIVAPRLAAA